MWLRSSARSVAVCSAHHQGIATVGDGLLATAWADDQSVEAVEDPASSFTVGVLWHPEAGDDLRLFEALVVAAQARRLRRPAATR